MMVVINLWLMGHYYRILSNYSTKKEETAWRFNKLERKNYTSMFAATYDSTLALYLKRNLQVALKLGWRHNRPFSFMS